MGANKENETKYGRTGSNIFVLAWPMLARLQAKSKKHFHLHFVSLRIFMVFSAFICWTHSCRLMWSGSAVLIYLSTQEQLDLTNRLFRLFHERYDKLQPMLCTNDNSIDHAANSPENEREHGFRLINRSKWFFSSLHWCVFRFDFQTQAIFASTHKHRLH